MPEEGLKSKPRECCCLSIMPILPNDRYQKHVQSDKAPHLRLGPNTCFDSSLLCRPFSLTKGVDR